MNIGEKVGYFYESLLNFRKIERQACPNCGCSSGHTMIEKKYLVTSLAECPNCYLRFRMPTDKIGFNDKYYQSEYREGFTTDCPNDEDLVELLKGKFIGHEKDFSSIISLFKALNDQPDLAVCDYGSSWGYGVWQLMQAGFQVAGYEPSEPRCRFAREKMGVRMLDDATLLTSKFDIFFSSHVLEHVPCIEDIWDKALRVLKPGGLFIAITPNGCEDLRKQHPYAYTKSWGKTHPNMLTAAFYANLFGDRPYMMYSSSVDFEDLAKWDKREKLILSLTGFQLISVAVV